MAIFSKLTDIYNVKNSELYIGEHNIVKLISRYDTPAYIYDASIIKNIYESVKADIPSANIYYSVKANPHPGIISVLKNNFDIGVETASEGEIKLSIKAGIDPEKIIFAGPGKRISELEYAIKKEIKVINVESVNELKSIVKISEDICKKVKVAIRLNLAVDSKSYPKALMVGKSQKFGVLTEDLPSMIKILSNANFVELIGFHLFAGTQILDSEILIDIYRQLVDFVYDFSKKNHIVIRYLNFGGGFGIPFKDEDDYLDTKKIGSFLDDISKKFSDDKNFCGTEIVLELGRYLVGRSGIYISKIIDIKKSESGSFLITDGGIHHALSPIVMNKHYPTYILNKLDHTPSDNFLIAGPLCTSADIFSRSLKLPNPEIGDLIGIFNSGAYGYTASMNLFLSHRSPYEFLIDESKLMILREQIEIDIDFPNKIIDLDNI